MTYYIDSLIENRIKDDRVFAHFLLKQAASEGILGHKFREYETGIVVLGLSYLGPELYYILPVGHLYSDLRPFRGHLEVESVQQIQPSDSFLERVRRQKKFLSYAQTVLAELQQLDHRLPSPAKRRRQMKQTFLGNY